MINFLPPFSLPFNLTKNTMAQLPANRTLDGFLDRMNDMEIIKYPQGFGLSALLCPILRKKLPLNDTHIDFLNFFSKIEGTPCFDTLNNFFIKN